MSHESMLSAAAQYMGDKLMELLEGALNRVTAAVGVVAESISSRGSSSYSNQSVSTPMEDGKRTEVPESPRVAMAPEKSAPAIEKEVVVEKVVEVEKNTAALAAFMALPKEVAAVVNNIREGAADFALSLQYPPQDMSLAALNTADIQHGIAASNGPVQQAGRAV